MKNLKYDIHVPKTEFISLQTDFGFKRIFGSEKRKSILIRFLNALFEGEFFIEDVIYKDKELLLPIEDRKRIVYDVCCVSVIDGRTHHFILEMQNYYDKVFADRALFYVSTAIALQGERNSNWLYDIESVFSIMFMSDSLSGMSPRLLRKIMLVDADTHEVFTTKLRMFFISFNRMNKEWDECVNDLEKYIYLIKNMETMDKSSKAYKSGEFEDLFDASERIVMEPAEALAYSDSYLRMKTFRHNLDLVRDESLQAGRAEGLQAGRAEGLQAGRAEGLQAGRAEGLQAGKLEVAKKMLELKTNTSVIFESLLTAPRSQIFNPLKNLMFSMKI